MLNFTNSNNESRKMLNLWLWDEMHKKYFGGHQWTSANTDFVHI